MQLYKSCIMTKTKIPESFLPINIQPRKYESFKNNYLQIIKLIISKMVLALAPRYKTLIDKGSERFMPQQNATPHK